MKPVHDLLDVCSVVPVVDIENVEVGCAEALEARLDGEVQGLDVVTAVVDLLCNSGVSEMGVVGVLCGKNKLAADSPGLLPLADELLRRPALAFERWTRS